MAHHYLYRDPYDTAQISKTGLTGVLRGIDPNDPALHHILTELRALTPLGEEPTREAVQEALRAGRQAYRDHPEDPGGALKLMTVADAAHAYKVRDTTIYRWIRDDRICSYGTRPVLVNGQEVRQIRDILHPNGEPKPREAADGGAGPAEPEPTPAPEPALAEPDLATDWEDQETLRRERDEALTETAALREQLQEAHSEIIRLLAEYERLKADLGTTQAEASNLRSQLDDVRGTLRALTGRISP